MVAGSFTILTTCSDPNKDDNPVIEKPNENIEKEPEEDIEEPEEPELDAEYIFADKHESIEQWDAAILGKDGIDCFYKFSDNNLPEQLALWKRNSNRLFKYIVFQFS